MRRSAWVHRLTDVDPGANTATCSACGPDAKIVWKWNWNTTTKAPRCAKSVAEGKARRRAAETPEARAVRLAADSARNRAYRLDPQWVENRRKADRERYARRVGRELSGPDGRLPPAPAARGKEPGPNEARPPG